MKSTPDPAPEVETPPEKAPPTTSPPGPAPAQPAPAMEGMGWGDLVAAKYGERKSAPEPEQVAETTPEPEAESGEEVATAADKQVADVSSLRSEISTEVKAAFSNLVEDLRGSVQGTSEMARADADRLVGEMQSRLERVEEALDSRIKHLSEQVRWIDHRIASTLDSTKEDVQDLALRIERGLAEATDRISQAEQLRTKTDALETALHNVLDNIDEMGAVSRRPVAEFSGTLPLNSATFEQLRGLGFSVTQSARIIAYRDTHGGFSDMDELREVRGLSQEDLRLLAERATL